MREVLTNSASLTRRSEKASRERAYDIHWKTSDLTFDEKTKNYFGTMVGVSGTIFEKDKPAATFTSEEGEADKSGTSKLTLRGHVRVISTDGQSELTCDKVVWLVDEKTIKASSLVKVRGRNGIVGPMDDLWATPDLKRVATPDMFGKP